jgi:Domain of unknown function (DUF4331)
MSHHFDTKLAKEDPSLNICDFYLFEGPPGRTVMAMTLNPDVGLSASDVLHIEGLYAFRFDRNSSGIEDLSFKVRFGLPRHAIVDEHKHVQSFQVRRADGPDATRHDVGSVIIEGTSGEIAVSPEVKAFVGTAPDMFAGDAVGLHAFLSAHREKRFDGDAFSTPRNFFARRNVTAIVLEVPNHMIGSGKVHAWATASLYGHAAEVQVSRWGLPLITHIFLSNEGDPTLIEKFNTTTPSQDVDMFAEPIAKFLENVTTYAASAANPGEYGKHLATRLCPTVLPYEIGTAASFDQAKFNGRPLADDVMDVMLSLASNKRLKDGAIPDRARIKNEFPYFGAPYTTDEQKTVVPVSSPPPKH